MNYKSILTIPLLLLSLGGANTVSADIVLTMTPSAASFDVGDSGFIDLMIYSDSAEALVSYFYGVNIAGGPGVTFTDPQSENFLSDGNYVFSGSSSNVNNSFAATLVGASGSEITAFDVTEATMPVNLPNAGAPNLLARLDFDTSAAGVFEFTFDDSSSFSDGFATEFMLASTGTSITVQTAAVPEPSSMILLGTTCLGAGWRHHRRKRRAAASAT